jgi:hypothetical protein
VAADKRRAFIPVLLILLGCAAASLVFAPTLHYGFVYDDYHQLRPFTLEAVGRTFHGSWDPTGVEATFYRPLTAAFFALRFQVLGLDAHAYHALSVLLFGICAGLSGWFVLRAGAAAGTAVGTTLLFVAHPVMPVAQVAWITNQMHLVESLVVLAALLAWQAARTRDGSWWGLVFVLAAAAFLVKEDAIMLLPVVFALEAAWQLLVQWRPIESRKVLVLIASGAGLLGGLLALRWAMLEQTGGYGWPGWEAAGPNFWRGPRAVLAFSRIPPPWRPALCYTTIALFAAAALATLLRFRLVRREAFVCASGVAALTLFNLPFALVSKPEQYHLIGLGGVLAIAGCLGVLAEALGRRSWLAWGGGVVLAAAMLPGSIGLARNYAPFGTVTRASDEIVLGWDVVPTELRDAVRRKNHAGLPGPLRLGASLPLVSYGMYGWETNPYGWRYRWTGDRAVVLVAPGTRAVVLPVSAAVMPSGDPVTVAVSVNGAAPRSFRLTNTGMTKLRVPLASPRPWWRWPGTTWVEVRVSPTGTPSVLDRGSSDHRALGVMLGEVELER